MHKNVDAEHAIRHLAMEWILESGYQPRQDHYPSFSDITTSKHLSHYLIFRSRVDARYEAESWFNSEITNYWRALRPRGV